MLNDARSFWCDHPNLFAAGFEGHPLRKDFPLTVGRLYNSSLYMLIL